VYSESGQTALIGLASALEASEPKSEARPLDTIRVSLGSAGVLGLLDVAQRDLPTTTYLMIGDRCRRDCAFCAQARTSRARADALSRITWPRQDFEATAVRIAAAYRQGLIQRCCLQVTAAPGYLERTEYVLSRLAALSAIPLSASIVARRPDDVRWLFRAGAQRIGLALDAATTEVHRSTKGPGWEGTLGLLEAMADEFPGRLSTHLMVGLGETEADLVTLFQRLADHQIMVALFAFTPLPGTALEGRSAPLLVQYRRLQAARFLIAAGQIRAEDIVFAPDGCILSYGLQPVYLRNVLSDGRAFQTSGCPDCNRPYYNERPGGMIYNYPRPLLPEEIAQAIALLPDT